MSYHEYGEIVYTQSLITRCCRQFGIEIDMPISQTMKCVEYWAQYPIVISDIQKDGPVQHIINTYYGILYVYIDNPMLELTINHLGSTVEIISTLHLQSTTHIGQKGIWNIDQHRCVTSLFTNITEDYSIEEICSAIIWLNSNFGYNYIIHPQDNVLYNSLNYVNYLRRYASQSFSREFRQELIQQLSAEHIRLEEEAVISNGLKRLHSTNTYSFDELREQGYISVL